MRYQDFIEELKGHVAEARTIRAAKVTDQDPGFRRWRHRVESLVREAEAHGYRLPGGFESPRRFYTDPYQRSEASSIEALSKDVSDTEIELSYLIEQFERYGVPPLGGGALPAPAVVQSVQSEPPVPERVTLYWLFKHVSIGVWVALGAALLSALLLGVAIGKTQWFAELSAWLSTSWPR